MNLAVTSRTPETLGDGRTAMPGDRVTIEELTPSDRRLIARGALVELPSPADSDPAAFVNDSTVEEILAAAESDPGSASALLEAEQARTRPRKGVIDALTTDKE